ncbi:MAG: response regulator [Spirochaetaceae bacterium]|jgi:DNA-binding response OmpR family regulator|nr:response regulator [Spirochaetaceae bacterium]
MNLHKKILIVDDEIIHLEFFEVMLSKLGFIVEKADNGLEALETVKWFYPDLIMLDNLMPRMSGWELTKILKGDPKFREIPIIMFSALDDVKDKVESFELGVDDYITKPFNFSEVLARIRVVLRNRELLTQIAARESRLHLAETLNADLKYTMADCIKSIDELDTAIAQVDQTELTPMLKNLRDKTRMARNHLADLDVRIEKTIAQWESLKKNEIGLATLEEEIHTSVRQE